MEMNMNDPPETEFRPLSPARYRCLMKLPPHVIYHFQLDLTVPNNNNDNNPKTKKDEDDDDDMVITTTSMNRCWEDEIPTEILVKILSVVPIRRLVQYLCISKTWFHTLSHHMDPNLLSANQEPGLIVIHNRRGNPTRLSFNVRQGGVKPKSIDYAPFEILFSSYSSFESSCNGLICLKQYSSEHICSSNSSSSSNVVAAKYRILICNPYLLEATTLPNINNNSSSSSLPPKQQQQHHDEQNWPFNFKENYGLGFSPSTDEYKVVRVTWFDEDHVDMIHNVSYRKNKQDGSITTIIRLRQPEKIQILTLGTRTTATTNSSYGGMITNSWRDVSSVPPLPIYGAPVFANGSLHWKVDTRNNKIISYIKDFGIIISFDIGTEKFHIIRQPPFVRRFSETGNLYMINWRGSLAVVKYGLRLFDIWVLKLNNSNNNKQQWIREYTIKTGDWWRTKVIGPWEHGEILCSFRMEPTLISFDLKTSKSRLIHVRSGFDHKNAYRREFQAHTGSLVSLKSYGCKTWRTAPGLICSNLYDRDNALFSKEEEGVEPTTVQLLTEIEIK